MGDEDDGDDEVAPPSTKKRERTANLTSLGSGDNSKRRREGTNRLKEHERRRCEEGTGGDESGWKNKESHEGLDTTTNDAEREQND